MAQSEGYGPDVSAEVLPGWTTADGTILAAIRFELGEGWKTYWRAPGEGGIPPMFSWSGSRNLAAVDPAWPAPVVFMDNGLRSVGYMDTLVLPLRITPKRTGKDVVVNGRLDIGVCQDVCVPATLKVKARLPHGETKIDPVIAASLADLPYTAEEGEVSDVSCALRPSQNGIKVSATIDLPSTGGTEFAVIETDNPALWVREADIRREGQRLHVSSEILHAEEKPFFLQRNGLRFTILGAHYAVDIQGC